MKIVKNFGLNPAIVEKMTRKRKDVSAQQIKWDVALREAEKDFKKYGVERL